MFGDFQRQPDRRAAVLFLVALMSASVLMVFGVWVLSLLELGDAEAALPDVGDPSDIVVELAPALDEEEPEAEAEPEPEERPEPEPRDEPAIVAPEPAEIFRPAAVRPEITMPTDIPDGELAESDGPLAEVEDTGPVGGDIRGRVGGRGTGRRAEGTSADPVVRATPPPPPPPPPRERRRARSSTEDVTKPRPRFRCEAPRAAREEGISGRVFVDLQVDEQGRLIRYNILRGPDVLQAAVRDCLREHWQEWTPARDTEGGIIAYRFRYQFPFIARNL